MDRTPGTWRLYQFRDYGYAFVGSVAVHNDVDGDTLYDWMEENITGHNADDYEYDGDSEFVAVMPKREGLPDYRWEFCALHMEAAK